MRVNETGKTSDTSERDCKRRVCDVQRRCSLCKERLRDAHSHPGQWKSELQQFLLTYSKVSVGSCVCKPCERSMRRELDGKFKGEFIPRWIKHGLKKQDQCCCVPGCGKTSERSCVFASFDIICEAANVNVNEAQVTKVASPFPLCSQHYYVTYNYCRSEPECVLCGSKSKHCAGVDRCQSARPLPQPQSITLMLNEVGQFDKCLDTDSVACNSCYQFCKRLLQQYGDDIRTAEDILELLRAKVTNIKERVHKCMQFDEMALHKAALFLGEEMLVDYAVRFSIHMSHI